MASARKNSPCSSCSLAIWVSMAEIRPLGLAQVVHADHGQVVGDVLGFLDQPAHESVRPEFGHAEAARVGHGLDPGDRLRRIGRQAAQVGVDQACRRTPTASGR